MMSVRACGRLKHQLLATRAEDLAVCRFCYFCLQGGANQKKVSLKPGGRSSFRECNMWRGHGKLPLHKVENMEFLCSIKICQTDTEANQYFS